MKEAAVALDFEAAARLRDQLFELKARLGGVRAARADMGNDDEGERKGGRDGRDGGRRGRGGRSADARAGGR